VISALRGGRRMNLPLRAAHVSKANKKISSNHKFGEAKQKTSSNHVSEAN
jgi:hypothetical protein